MHLTNQERETYERSGYLFWPEQLPAEEVAALRAELPVVMSQPGAHRVLEKDGLAVRSVYGVHETNAVLGRLTRHPALVTPASDALQSPVYVHQFKINAKAAFGGDVWEWHQDYIFWRNEDGMPSARVLTICVFLDDVTEFNGPMYFLPGSHLEGVVEPAARGGGPPPGYEGGPAWIGNLTASLKYGLDRDCISRLVQRHGIVAPKGPAGSVLMFDGNIVHGSAGNMSPWDRMTAMVTYNSVHNILPERDRRRPEFLASRKFDPVVPDTSTSLAAATRHAAV